MSSQIRKNANVAAPAQSSSTATSSGMGLGNSGVLDLMGAGMLPDLDGFGNGEILEVLGGFEPGMATASQPGAFTEDDDGIWDGIHTDTYTEAAADGSPDPTGTQEVFSLDLNAGSFGRQTTERRERRDYTALTREIEAELVALERQRATLLGVQPIATPDEKAEIEEELAELDGLRQRRQGVLVEIAMGGSPDVAELRQHYGLEAPVDTDMSGYSFGLDGVRWSESRSRAYGEVQRESGLYLDEDGIGLGSEQTLEGASGARKEEHVKASFDGETARLRAGSSERDGAGNTRSSSATISASDDTLGVQGAGSRGKEVGTDKLGGSAAFEYGGGVSCTVEYLPRGDGYVAVTTFSVNASAGVDLGGRLQGQSLGVSGGVAGQGSIRLERPLSASQRDQHRAALAAGQGSSPEVMLLHRLLEPASKLDEAADASMAGLRYATGLGHATGMEPGETVSVSASITAHGALSTSMLGLGVEAAGTGSVHQTVARREAGVHVEVEVATSWSVDGSGQVTLGPARLGASKGGGETFGLKLESRSPLILEDPGHLAVFEALTSCWTRADLDAVLAEHGGLLLSTEMEADVSRWGVGGGVALFNAGMTEESRTSSAIQRGEEGVVGGTFEGENTRTDRLGLGPVGMQQSETEGALVTVDEGGIVVNAVQGRSNAQGLLHTEWHALMKELERYQVDPQTIDRVRKNRVTNAVLWERCAATVSTEVFPEWLQLRRDLLSPEPSEEYAALADTPESRELAVDLTHGAAVASFFASVNGAYECWYNMLTSWGETGEVLGSVGAWPSSLEGEQRRFEEVKTAVGRLDTVFASYAQSAADQAARVHATELVSCLLVIEASVRTGQFPDEQLRLQVQAKIMSVASDVTAKLRTWFPEMEMRAPEGPFGGSRSGLGDREVSAWVRLCGEFKVEEGELFARIERANEGRSFGSYKAWAAYEKLRDLYRRWKPVVLSTRDAHRRAGIPWVFWAVSRDKGEARMQETEPNIDRAEELYADLSYFAYERTPLRADFGSY